MYWKDDEKQEENTGKVILICGFGTADIEEMKRTFGRLMERARRKAPGQTVLLALTSRKVISSLYEKYGIRVRDVKTALEEAVQGGALQIRILPVLVAGGSEYDKLGDLTQAFRGREAEIELGDPLLAGSGSCRLAKFLIEETEARNIRKDEAFLYIGHGSHDKGPQAQAAYRSLQTMLRKKGSRNVFIGDLRTGPEPVIKALGAASFRRIHLRPLMMVTGYHWNKDVAGEGSGTWKSTLRDAGFEVYCEKEGLLEKEAVLDIICSHAG